MREATKRGAPIEIDDFERRLRSQEPRRGAPGNPLRELARLMQGEEQVDAALRYSRMFEERRPVAEEPAPDYRFRPAKRTPPGEEAIRAAVPDEVFAPQPAWRRPPPPPIAEEDLPPPLRGSLDEEERRETEHDARYAPRDAHYGEESYRAEHYPPEADYAHDQSAAAHDFGMQDYAMAAAPEGRSGSYEESGEWAGEFAGEGPAVGAQAKRPRFRLRPWHGVALATIVGVGGVAWAIGHIKGAIGSREIATIQAPEGPVKVPPSAQTDGGAAPKEVAVLDRQENTPVRNVATHQEQPLEPTIERRAAGPVEPPRQVITGVEAKRVKTLTIRDGAPPIDAGTAPAAVERAAGGAPSRDNAPAHASTTPKAAPKQATTAQAGAPPRAAKPAAPKPQAPQKQIAETEQGAEVAEETAPAASNASGGGFAVQFGAAANEAEARALMLKVAQKYGAQLGGHRPTFKMAKVGDKTVYRVRAGGMSKESATSVCNAVKSSGGNCFIAGN